MGRVNITIKWVIAKFPLNNCPNCLRGKVFKGVISLNSNCSKCNISFDENKIGDGATWISSSILCILSIPIVLLFNFYLKVSFFYLFLLLQ